jgi:hypothetical protein
LEGLFLCPDQENILLVQLILVHEGIVYSEQLEDNSKRVVLQYLVAIYRFLPLLNLFESRLELTKALGSCEVLALQSLEFLPHLFFDQVELLSLIGECLLHFVASQCHLR